MQYAHCQLNVLFLNQNGDLDFGSADHENIDAFLRKGGKCAGRDAGMVAHANTNGRNLGHAHIVQNFGCAGFFGNFFHHRQSLLQIFARNGEGDVRMTVQAGVLNNHVDQNAFFRERPEHGSGTSRAGQGVVDVAGDAPADPRGARVDPTQIDETIAAFEGADLVWLESPTNPLLDVLDLPTLITAAKQRGAIVVVDNTFSTPLRQRPLEFGADLVVHSATKFIAGHSDVLLGLAVTSDVALRERLLAKRTLQGSIPGPFEAWLALRGLRTLAVRLDRAEQTAAELAPRLAERAELSRVRYPGLPTDPGHGLAAAQMGGCGAMISIEFAGGAAAAERFVESLGLITPATSLGGVETLAERRRRQPSEPLAVPESLVRLSIGIEHVEDLWADIEQALAAL